MILSSLWPAMISDLSRVPLLSVSSLVNILEAFFMIFLIALMCGEGVW